MSSDTKYMLAPILIIAIFFGVLLWAAAAASDAARARQDFECVRRHGYLATIEPGYQRVCLSDFKILEFNEVGIEVK